MVFGVQEEISGDKLKGTPRLSSGTREKNLAETEERNAHLAHEGLDTGILRFTLLSISGGSVAVFVPLYLAFELRLAVISQGLTMTSWRKATENERVSK